MKTTLAIAFAALALTACSKPAEPAKAPAPPPVAANFVINPLTEADNTIQGCTTSLSRRGDTTGEIFLEDGVDSGAKGFIRIDGALINVGLVDLTESETGATRTFADTADTVRIVETLTVGQAHEESDSVDMSGTLAVTYRGATRTIPVEGGTAC